MLSGRWLPQRRAASGVAAPTRLAGSALVLAAWTLAPHVAQGDVTLTVDPGVREQTVEGWGTCMVTWRMEEAPYEDPRWRAAYRDMGANTLRVPMMQNVLVHPSGDMARPVRLGPDLERNVERLRFDHPGLAAVGDMARWLTEHALEPERVRIVGAIWSPPHWMKGPTGFRQSFVRAPDDRRPTPWLSEGTGGSSIGGRLLQTPDNLTQFARYVAAWIVGFERAFGVHLHAVSLQNESTYENPFDSATYELGPSGERRQWWQWVEAVDAVSRELRRHGIDTGIMGPSVANVSYLERHDISRLEQQMGFIVAARKRGPALLDAIAKYDSNGYMGLDEAAARSWAAYWNGTEAVRGGWPWWLRFRGVRGDGKPVWVSEAGGGTPPWLRRDGREPGDGAITVAHRMHDALIHGHASAYVYWQLSDHGDRESEHTLLGKARLNAPFESPKLAAYAHFSRFIRPGAVRVGAAFPSGAAAWGGRSRYDTAHALTATAWVHPTDRRLTLVLLNQRPTPVGVEVVVPASHRPTTVEVITTDPDRTFDRERQVAWSGGRLRVPAYGLVTVSGELAAAPGVTWEAPSPGPRDEPWPDLVTVARVRAASQRAWPWAGAALLAVGGLVALRRLSRRRPARDPR